MDCPVEMFLAMLIFNADNIFDTMTLLKRINRYTGI